MSKKLLCVVGPTASGKTALAVSLAKKLNGYLLSADSRQVYRGLDIISGKDVPKDAQFQRSRASEFDISTYSDYTIGYYDFISTHVYGLDVVDPTYSFSVYDFLTIVPPILTHISSEEKLPILVGGAGFYMKALLDGLNTLSIPPNEELRKNLSQKRISELQELLQKENPDKYYSMNDSDQKNPRRLIRAIEIAQTYRQMPRKMDLQDYTILMIGLTANQEMLKERIDRRVDARIKIGAQEEAETLFKQYKALSEQVKTANGYKQLFDYFLGKITKEEAILAWRRSEYLNAKKQMTWFKKDKRVCWFDISNKNFLQNVFQIVDSWYNTN